MKAVRQQQYMYGKQSAKKLNIKINNNYNNNENEEEKDEVSSGELQKLQT